MPETRSGFHWIPVTECDVTATIELSKEKGIFALYCGGAKTIHTYKFDAKKWSMEQAMNWVRKQREQTEANVTGGMDGEGNGLSRVVGVDAGADMDVDASTSTDVDADVETSTSISIDGDIPDISVTPSCARRIAERRRKHIVVSQAGEQWPALTPVYVTDDGDGLHAKIVLSRPRKISEDIYSYNFTVLEVYNPPRRRKRNGSEGVFSEAMRQAFGSPGGKHLLAGTIVALMPKHKTFVEAFAGGAAVFFKKDKNVSQREVLNDVYPDLVATYKFIRDASPEEIRKFKALDWTLRKPLWEKLKAMKPASPMQRVYRFLYVRLGSFAHGEDTFSPSAHDAGRKIGMPERFEALQERLRGVKLHNEDWLSVCKKYDAEDTWIFADPPYPGDKPGWDKTPEGPTLEQLAKGLRSLKSKWLLTINDTKEVVAAFKGCNIRRVKINTRAGRGGDMREKADTELMIANYPLRGVQKEEVIVDGNGQKYLIEAEDIYREPVQTQSHDLLSEAQHSRSRCMGCDDVPVVDVHWANGRARAWFCLRHFRDWIAEDEREIVRAWHVISGEAPVKMGDGEGEQVKKLRDGLKQDDVLEAIVELEKSGEKSEKESEENPNASVKETLLDEHVSWRLPPFSSEGGGYFLAPIIRDILPACNTYCEPFAGAASVLFSRPPVTTEVLNDTDRDLIQAYEDIRSLTLSQLIELRNRNWHAWERRFKRLRDGHHPKGEVDRLYRFLYLSWYSFNENRKNYRGRPKNWDLEARLGRVENARVRLREVRLSSEDGISCIKRWDGPDTAFFLDPPFPASEDGLNALREALEGVQGKFVLRISDEPEHRDLLSEYNIMPTTVARRAGRTSPWKSGEIIRTRPELLVTNCALPDQGKGLECTDARAST